MSQPTYGRRQAFLILLGGIYVIIGCTYATETAPSPGNPFAAALHLIPTMHVWGSLWALDGLIAVVCSTWPPGRDMWGFGALASWSVGWAILCLSSTLIYDSERGWIAGLVWGTFGLLVLIVSGMYGRSDRVRRMDEL